MPKRGLVISGGGVKGAFGVGVLEYLMKVKGLTFDFVVGTSTGGLITPYVVTGDIDLIKDIYSNVDSSDILGNVGWTEAFSLGYLNNVDPLWKLIQTNITDERWAKVQASSSQMSVVTVDFQTSNTVYFHSKDKLNVLPPAEERTLQSTEDLRHAILASGCEPCFMPTVHITQNGQKHQYVDGGVRDYAPISLALLNGVEELYVIILSPAGYHDTNTEYTNLVNVLLRTIELLSDAVGTQNIGMADQTMQSILYINGLKQSLVQKYGWSSDQADQLLAGTLAQPNPFVNFKLKTAPIIIRPEVPLTYDSLNFQTADMRRMIQTGYDRAQSVVV
jgi:predicted patatin/cPLA2 family phospholipase